MFSTIRFPGIPVINFVQVLRSQPGPAAPRVCPSSEQYAQGRHGPRDILPYITLVVHPSGLSCTRQGCGWRMIRQGAKMQVLGESLP